PPVIQFGNFHVGESSALRDLLEGNDEVCMPGSMPCDMRSVHRGVKRLSKQMHDRYKTEKRMAKILRQEELRRNGQAFDITALDSAVRANTSENSKMMRLITDLSREFSELKCDVTRLQALVDKKRIVITEEVVHEILQLNDAEGVICLPNEEIFAGLARMGYEKPSTKLTFYKAFFSTQWKFFIHTILHSLSAKRTSWNEFSLAMASAVICLSSGQRVRKGFSGVEIPLFESMLVVRDVAEEAEAQSPPSPVIPSLP
nr:hypothetical protein [Tanacetum cinerariifolium]